MTHRFLNSKNAYAGILLLGIVSLIGDVIYEGSRGLVPDYLRFLGASALIVGIVGGLGEFLGYSVRLVSGVLSDTTRAYWFFIFLGYGLIASIPLLGFASGWEIAVVLVLLERLGKALRSPSRDTVLSVISKDVGTGKAFGIHELLDQIGATTGPLIVAALMFYSSNSYEKTFAFLVLPFGMLLAALAYTYRKIGPKTITESETMGHKSKVLGRSFYVYTFAVMLNTVGLIPVALILFRASAILQPEHVQWIVPLIYLLIQGVDGSVALFSGYAYDKFGIKVLTLPFVLSLLPPLFAMANFGMSGLIIASVFFGVVLGMQESIYRAAVSEFTSISSRGTAYGVFNLAYGVGFLVSGGVYGLMLSFNSPFILTVVFVVLTQAAAISALQQAHKRGMEKE